MNDNIKKIFEKIKELYADYPNDGHGLDHLSDVCYRSLDIYFNYVKQNNDNLDIESIKLAAVLHDVGNLIDRDFHEIHGVGILRGNLSIGKIMLDSKETTKFMSRNERKKIVDYINNKKDCGYIASKTNVSKNAIGNAIFAKCYFDKVFSDKDEKQTINLLRRLNFPKPIIAYIEEKIDEKKRCNLWVYKPQLKEINQLFFNETRDAKQRGEIRTAINDHNKDNRIVYINGTRTTQPYNHKSLIAMIIYDADKDISFTVANERTQKYHKTKKDKTYGNFLRGCQRENQQNEEFEKIYEYMRKLKQAFNAVYNYNDKTSNKKIMRDLDEYENFKKHELNDILSNIDISKLAQYNKNNGTIIYSKEYEYKLAEQVLNFCRENHYNSKSAGDSVLGADIDSEELFLKVDEIVAKILKNKCIEKEIVYSEMARLCVIEQEIIRFMPECGVDAGSALDKHYKQKNKSKLNNYVSTVYRKPLTKPCETIEKIQEVQKLIENKKYKEKLQPKTVIDDFIVIEDNEEGYNEFSNISNDENSKKRDISKNDDTPIL